MASYVLLVDKAEHSEGSNHERGQVTAGEGREGACNAAFSGDVFHYFGLLDHNCWTRVATSIVWIISWQRDLVQSSVSRPCVLAKTRLDVIFAPGLSSRLKKRLPAGIMQKLHIIWESPTMKVNLNTSGSSLLRPLSRKAPCLSKSDHFLA